MPQYLPVTIIEVYLVTMVTTNNGSIRAMLKTFELNSGTIGMFFYTRLKYEYSDLIIYKFIHKK